ncbi:MAG: dihydrolipoyl dehydrogenase [Clostridiales bacterium]|nr:MAG: dihydrolipoyl dehydrogenase [Clostridiales bacterium]
MNKFDLAVIGAGPGGYVTAIKAASLGLKTVLFEKEFIGGVCLNVGCIPSKALMKSAHLFDEIKKADEFGLTLGNNANPDVDWTKLIKRKDGVVSKLTGGVKMLLKGAGVTVVEAFAEAKDAKHIVADGKEYEVKNMILALGSSPSFPNVPGLKEAFDRGDVVDSTGILSLPSKPKDLVIIGGGVIALEFAIIYNAFGTKVTMLQRSSKILTGMDEDVRTAMDKVARKMGINIITNTNLKEIKGKTVVFEQNGVVQELSGEKILCSLGRKPNTKGVEALNLEMNKNSVKVDEYYRTSVPGVYAIGDMSSKLKLAHVASAEGLCALDHIVGIERTLDYNKMPAVIYGFPEAAVIGMTEEQVKEKGIEFETAKFPVAANGRSMAGGEKDGFIKIISDKNIGEILGVHMVASVASDMISQALMVMELEGTVADISLSVHPHPTNSEMVMEAAHILEGHPIHVSAPKKK